MKALLRLLRPHQWVKNLFVFVGVLFAHQWNNSALLLQAALAFVAFCLLASAIYILNDILDRHEDRKHPVKKHRPIAAATVTINTAVILGCVLAVSSLLCGFSLNIRVGWILIAYILLNISYSVFLKRMIILDVFAISAGFLLRILAGTIGIGIAPSGWLLLCSLMLTLFLGFSKRRAERFLLGSQQLTLPPVLEKYSPQFLDKALTITATGSMISYTLYTLSQDNKLYHYSHHFIYTVPLVIYGIFRYLYLVDNTQHTQRGLDVAYDIWQDKELLIIVSVWALSIIFIGF